MVSISDTYKKYVLSSTEESTTISIHCRFKPHGWATFMINNDVGTLSIQSDWGDWSYRWGTGSLGSPTLLIALRDRFDQWYVANKLFGGKTSAYDPYKTEESFKKKLLEARRRRDISKEDASELWYELDRVPWENVDALYYSLPSDEVFNKVFGSEWFFDLEESPLPSYEVFLELLHPALIKCLKERTHD